MYTQQPGSHIRLLNTCAPAGRSLTKVRKKIPTGNIAIQVPQCNLSTPEAIFSDGHSKRGIHSVCEELTKKGGVVHTLLCSTLTLVSCHWLSV